MTPGRKRAVHLVLLAVLAVLVFLINFRFVEGSSIASPDALSWDLTGRDHPPVQWIDDWMWHQDAPYKFRILGKLPVWATWRLFFSGQGSQGLLVSFALWGLAWLIATLLAFYSYLEMLAAEIPWKPGGRTPPLPPGAAAGKPSGALPLLGCLFFMASPPILFAFKFPVHTTPNDLLGYFLTVLALAALLKGRSLRVCGIACLAALCRETTLIVPVAYVLTTRDPWKRRVLLTSLPFLCWFAPRAIWWTPYNAAGGGVYNLSVPLESLAFLFLVFGPLWWMIGPGYADARRQVETASKTDAPASAWRVLVRSAPWVAGIVLFITAGLARVREMRILFVLFPFVIPFALVRWAGSRDRIRTEVRRWRYGSFLAACVAMALLLRENLVASSKEQALAVFGRLRHFYGGYGKGWLDIFYACLVLTLALIPLLGKSGRKKDAQANRPSLRT